MSLSCRCTHCVRGSCVGGKCKCPDGWKGDDCNTDIADLTQLTVDMGYVERNQDRMSVFVITGGTQIRVQKTRRNVL